MLLLAVSTPMRLVLSTSTIYTTGVRTAPGCVWTTGACCCTWTCLDNWSLYCSRKCLHHKGLSFTWTSLDNKSKWGSWTCHHNRALSCN